MITKEEAKNIIQFLMRADLKGNETMAFLQAVKALEKILTEEEEKADA